jgi:hypothetical protein
MTSVVSVRAESGEIESERRDDGPVQLSKLHGSEPADELRERRFGQADQFVAVKAAVVFQAFVRTNRNLGGPPVG